MKNNFKNRHAFTLAEVLMAKRVSDKTCSQEFVRASKPKAPSKYVNKLCAFTLAEVLITLAIIGVVAALTIPTVVKNYRKTQTVTQLKKVYTTLANTTNLAIADNGPISSWEVGEDKTAAAAEDFANKYLIPYLKVSKNCGTSTEGKCNWVSHRPDTKMIYSFSPSSYFYLVDGTFVRVSIRHFNETNGRIGFIAVDLNGQKAPNTHGIDQFVFSYRLHLGKMYPYGVENSTDRNYHLGTGCAGWDYCCTENGTYCAALIALDGWQIKDDYPWF